LMWDDGACTECDGVGREWDWDDDYRRAYSLERCHHCNGSGYEPTKPKPGPGPDRAPDPALTLSGWDEDPLERW